MTVSTSSRPPLAILLHGASGRMGQSLRLLIAAGDEASVAAAVAVRPADGCWPASRLGDVGEFDLAIDFSSPAGFDALLALCVSRGRPLVSGTTGLIGEQVQRLDAAAKRIPVLWAANFSLGVALLAQLVAIAARALPQFDCEIVEMHHRNKRDAPSGTALRLGEAVATARQQMLTEVAHAGRSGVDDRRADGEIGFHALRGGSVIGEHTVVFASEDERVELSHRAERREVFARGALTAALWLSARPAGRYRLEDVVDARLSPTEAASAIG